MKAVVVVGEFGPSPLRHWPRTLTRSPPPQPLLPFILRPSLLLVVLKSSGA